jgi:hypothetical protein
MKVMIAILLTIMLLFFVIITPGCSSELPKSSEPIQTPVTVTEPLLVPEPEPQTESESQSEPILITETTTEVELIRDLRGIPFTVERAYSQVTYYLFQLTRGSDLALEFFNLIDIDFNTEYIQENVDMDIQGHKHSGWILHSNRYEWIICSDGYVYENNKETKELTERILSYEGTSVSFYYLNPLPYSLIIGADDDVGDCRVGYIDIVRFETWRENTIYTFIIRLIDNVEMDNTTYKISIDTDRKDTGVGSSPSACADYIIIVDYKNNKHGLYEIDIVDKEFYKVRDFLELEVEGKQRKIVVDLQGIAFTWAGFQASAEIFSDSGGILARDTSPPWWYKRLP